MPSRQVSSRRRTGGAAGLDVLAGTASLPEGTGAGPADGLPGGGAGGAEVITAAGERPWPPSRACVTTIRCCLPFASVSLRSLLFSLVRTQLVYRAALAPRVPPTS